MSVRGSRPPRVVLDTNVVLSALGFGGGTPGAVRAAWQSGRFQPLISSTTAEELIRVLAYPKFMLTLTEREELLSDYLPWCKVVRVPAHPPAVPRLRDSNDRPFLEVAVAGKANALVTGDGDLIAIAKRFRIPIMAPATFLEWLELNLR